MSYSSLMNYVEMHLRVAEALGLFNAKPRTLDLGQVNQLRPALEQEALMPRGVAAKVGDTNVSDNGYHYTRTEGGWRLTHHLIAEEQLGRPIGRDETVRFKDSDRTNLSPDNIIVTTRRTSIRGRIAAIESKIMELQAEKANLEEQLRRIGQTTQSSS